MTETAPRAAAGRSVRLFLTDGSPHGLIVADVGNWNGKVLGVGGGGWMGNTTLQAVSEGLRKGYATLSTDAGHPAGNVWDTSWAVNP